MAALAIEDYRIERALNESGDWMSEGRVAQMRDVAAQYHEVLVELLGSWGCDIGSFRWREFNSIRRAC